jgi:serine/threonine protein kinase
LVDASGKKHDFSIHHESGKLHVSANCEELKAAWWSALQKAIQEAKERARDQKPGPQDFTKLALIGRGATGKVLKVKENRTGKIFALKVIYKDAVVQNSMQKFVLNESHILRTLEHPFIIRSHEAFQTDDKLFFVLDFHVGGSLHDHLRRHGWLAESHVTFYAAEVTLALLYLHSKQIMYRDLKLANVLIDAQGHVVLTDFGTASERKNAETFCGSPNYMAPEIVNHLPYTKAVDWWSCGCIIYNMVTGQPPFKSQTREELFKRILSYPLEWPTKVSKPCAELCEGLLNKDPLKRLQGTAVKVSPFFEGIDWDKVERRELHPPWVPDVGKDDLKYHDGSKKRGASKDTHHGVPSGEQQEGFDGFSFYASSKAGAAPAQNPQPSDAEKRYSMGGGIE